MQTRLESLWETFNNTFWGSIGALIITWWVLTYVPWSPLPKSALNVLLCTLWSLSRGFVVRRYFNRKLVQRHKSGAEPR